MNEYRRVVFLPDTFHEINGVAHTSRQLEAFVRRRQIPFFSVHPGTETAVTDDGVVRIMELKRSWASFPLDAHLDCDPLLMRHAQRLVAEAECFGAEVVHITGPGDMGILGCYLAWRLGLPLAMGWHTSLHEYAGSRLERMLPWAPETFRQKGAIAVQRKTLDYLRWFYQKARVILAPNDELVGFMHELMARPTFLMQRGVDTNLFSPQRRKRETNTFRIGYVGRLTPEKNVRFLAELAEMLQQKGHEEFEFTIIGQGSEREWLRENVPHSTFPGVLRGEDLARAYADLDLFVFPSTTDTFGNVVLEALASGVPCVVTNSGGPKFLVQTGVTGYVAEDFASFGAYVNRLLDDLERHRAMRDAARRYACTLSWDSVFEKVFDAYRSCFSTSETKAGGFDTPALSA